eukprot:g3183.t1
MRLIALARPQAPQSGQMSFCKGLAHWPSRKPKPQGSAIPGSTAQLRFLQSPEGRLYKAAKDGDIEGVAAACAEGAKLDVPMDADPVACCARFGSQPLVMATLNGHTECVHYLLEERADVEQRNKFGWTPLLAACSKGNLMLSGYLITRMADISAQEWGQTDGNC